MKKDQQIGELASPDRWSRIETVFDAALAFGPAERPDFVKQTCAGDDGLQREVESLLAADATADDLLNSDALELYMKIIEEETLKDDLAQKTALDANLSSGMILGQNWEILSPLNAGGMGEVYKARDLALDRIVVVKVLKRESQTNPWKVKKFGDEAIGQGRIRHPNVATVFAKGALPSGEQYLVMEFIDGSTLGDVIKAHKGNDDHMEFSMVAEIVRQLGRGVAAIHKAGLVHRDLKPENIMIQNHGDELVVKIIDFGIVRVLDKSTVWGQAVGTPIYMSPEQLRGEDANFRSDIYGLAVIAYEMLTRRRPFEAQNSPHLLELQKNIGRLRPNALRDDLPPATQKVILKALSYQPNKRPSQVRDFSDELARTLSEVAPVKAWWRSGKVRLAAAILLAAVLGSVLWGSWAFVKPGGSIATLGPGALAGTGPERSFSYSLHIVRKGDGKMTPATGRETFDTGDQFRLSFVPSQAGALYLFNEGTSGNWHLLFPTRKNHQENPQLAALEKIETDGYEFTNRSGLEKGKERIWIVWATAPVPLLDEVIKQAVKTDLTVTDSTQQSALQEFMFKSQSPYPNVNFDEKQSQFTLRGRADVFSYLMELESKDWK